MGTAPQPWIQYFRGDTDWRATIHLNNKLVDISAESTLRGLASDLPEPFSKAAADAALLRLERKAVSPDRDRLVVTYGNTITATINRSRDSSGNYHAETGDVTLGADSRPSSRKGGHVRNWRIASHSIWIGGAVFSASLRMSRIFHPT